VPAESLSERPIQLKVGITNLFDQKFGKKLRERIRRELSFAVRACLSEGAIVEIPDNGSFILSQGAVMLMIL
jgi:hypothetical protein|tara:strand:+ start:368 stop:583 length:216 start_codon:yes stop_codon:yes gene_type:complete